MNHLRQLKQMLQKIKNSEDNIEPFSVEQLYTKWDSCREKWTSEYARFASEPTYLEDEFEKRLEIILDKLDYKANNKHHVVVSDELMIVLENTTRICILLILETNSQAETNFGPICNQFFETVVLERIIEYGMQLMDTLKGICQKSLIKTYELIVTGVHNQNHGLIVHKPILDPLIKLCVWFGKENVYFMHEEDENQLLETDKSFVILLHQITAKMTTDKTLIEFLLPPEQLIIFTQLTRFLYAKDEKIMQLSRTGILSILSITSNMDRIANSIITTTNFCQVFSSGLSGLYSNLPNEVLGDGGERYVPETQKMEVNNLYTSLLFCDSVVRCSHNRIAAEIARYFYTGFLKNVVGPSILQNEDREMLAAKLCYLHLCVDTITEDCLVKQLVLLLLIPRTDSTGQLFEIIVSYCKTGDKASVAAIALLKTFLTLCCEDFMLALVFRPLLTNHNVSKRQLSSVYNRTRCSELAQRYLNCIPNCIQSYSEITSDNTLAFYMRDARILMEARSEQCKRWTGKYDGSSSDSFCLPAESDDDATCNVSFSRLSSSRSSMSMAALGLNRYARNSHPSHVFNIDQVCQLGEKQAKEDDYDLTNESMDFMIDIQEDNDYILPVLDKEMTTSKMMTSSTSDYMNISGMDEDLSDEASTTPFLLDQSSTSSTPHEAKKHNQKRDYMLSGWKDITDHDAFVKTLQSVKLNSERQIEKVEDICASINEKFEKMKTEKENLSSVEAKNENPQQFKKTKEGFTVYNFSEKSSLLNLVFEGIENLCDNEISFNVEIIALLTDIASYPQPILAYYLFDPKEDGIKSLLTILQSLKERIDIMSIGTVNLDVYIEQAINELICRKLRIDDANMEIISSEKEKHARYAMNSRVNKSNQSYDEGTDDCASKQLAISAILLSQVCQILSSITYHQSLII